MSSPGMRRLNVFAELCALPRNAKGIIARWIVILVLLFPIVIADRYFNTAAFVGMFVYLLGSLTTYGTVRVMLRQTEAGRKALEERDG